MSLSHQLYLQSLREADALSLENFDDFREVLIERFLNHACGNVDFYRQRLKPLIRDGAFDLSRWSNLPLLRSTDIARLGDALSSRSLLGDVTEYEAAAENALVPIPRRSVSGRIALECFREFIYERAGIRSSESLAIVHSDYADKPYEGSGWSITFPQSSWVRADERLPTSEISAWLAGTGCMRLQTSSKVAAGLLGEELRTRLDIILIVDNEMPDGLPEKLAKCFGSQIAWIVEQPILGPVAANFYDGRPCYAPSSNMIVEVVNSDGKPVDAGMLGELVVTPLYEYAFPLIRFATELQVIAPNAPPTAVGIRALGGIVGPISK